MAKLTHDLARKTLREGGNLAELTRAVAFLGDDPATKPEGLLPALDHPGYIADVAAIALHKITGAPGGEGRPAGHVAGLLGEAVEG